MAHASGLPPAALAVIRLSGPGSLARLRPLLKAQHPGAGFDRVLRQYNLSDPVNGELVDELTAVMFKAPRSYTGEDAAELYCHGGPYIVRRVLAVLASAGFVQAEPGEFTKRAFLNGKLDLTAAEGIHELISAQTHEQWLAARQLAKGKLRDVIDGLRKQLIGAMALLAARIDFPDEGDTQGVDLQQVSAAAAAVQATIGELLGTFQQGQIASQGLMVALVGAPNAGKSTLLNTLLRRDRALVSAEAGTTRDYLEERCLIGGYLVRLVDTAGIRTSQDHIETQGVARSLELMAQADIVLWLVPGGRPQPGEMQPAHAGVDPDKLVKIATKADLLPAAADWLSISAHLGTGLEALKARIASECQYYATKLHGEHAFITNERHLQALEIASQALQRYQATAAVQAADECLDFELQEAARALGGIIGVVDAEDILERVFSEFCVGK